MKMNVRSEVSPLSRLSRLNRSCNPAEVSSKEREHCSVVEERQPRQLAALKVLTPVTEGAGVVNGEEINRDKSGHMMYLRASFKRVFGSFNSESFHLIDPRGIIGQELSIFFFRSSHK
uniref:Uncharacterized protein n=1 Tax=Brassica oleracea var. oleracea TaxID=109376 RepID=A0A0D3CNJ2_BRAOL